MFNAKIRKMNYSRFCFLAINGVTIARYNCQQVAMNHATDLLQDAKELGEKITVTINGKAI